MNRISGNHNFVEQSLPEICYVSIEKQKHLFEYAEQ